MINEIKQDSEKRMKKTIESLIADMAKIRTGRANAGLLDHVYVDIMAIQLLSIRWLTLPAVIHVL